MGEAWHPVSGLRTRSTSRDATTAPPAAAAAVAAMARYFGCGSIWTCDVLVNQSVLVDIWRVWGAKTRNYTYLTTSGFFFFGSRFLSN